MKFYEIYEQNDPNKIESLIQFLPTATLITQNKNDEIECGVFNPIHIGNDFLIHFHRTDSQFFKMKEPSATLLFYDFLALIPSYWIDQRYGGAATTYYRFAQFQCSIELLKEPEVVCQTLEQIISHYQPEKKYEPLTPHSPIYKSSINELMIAKLTIQTRKTKWKLGQNRPPEIRRSVAEKLKERGSPLDIRAAQEVLNTLS